VGKRVGKRVGNAITIRFARRVGDFSGALASQVTLEPPTATPYRAYILYVSIHALPSSNGQHTSTQEARCCSDCTEDFSSPCQLDLSTLTQRFKRTARTSGAAAPTSRDPAPYTMQDQNVRPASVDYISGRPPLRYPSLSPAGPGKRCPRHSHVQRCRM
jgi:hypothetical protein